MLAISRMKALISQIKFSTFSSSHLPQAAPLALFSSTCKFILQNRPTLLQNPSLLHSKPTISFTPISVLPVQNRGLQMEAASPTPSGEIHVIVGPMFAGKTTTLLRRIQSESSNGRYRPSFAFVTLLVFWVSKVWKFMCFLLG